MSVWDTYENRADVHGKTRRDVSYIRETRMIDRKLPDNLSYQEVDIDGIDRTIAVINSDNLNEKNIYSMPGEDIPHGGLVSWMGNKWLITERDANTTVYTRAKMIQCNHLLKWIEEDGTLYEQWCIVEDGTKLTHAMRRVRWFGILETVCKNYSSICWNTLRAISPKRRCEQLQTVMV